jgi:hypothetical protein
LCAPLSENHGAEVLEDSAGSVRQREENPTDSLLFALPDGRQAHVSLHSAGLIRDRLWTLGITPGAATAAVRISEALWDRFRYEKSVGFAEREVAPLLEAAKVDPPTWRHGTAGAAESVSAEDRERLLAKCEELLQLLRAQEDHQKLSRLTDDIDRLRNRILAASYLDNR